MNQPIYMGCQRADEEPSVPSIRRKCVDCGHEIWVSFASLSRAHACQARLICMDCLMKHPDFPDAKYLPVSEAQIKELIEAWNKR